MSKFSQEIEVSGHLIDSSILTKIFDKIMDLYPEFLRPGILNILKYLKENRETVIHDDIRRNYTK